MRKKNLEAENRELKQRIADLEVRIGYLNPLNLRLKHKIAAQQRLLDQWSASATVEQREELVRSAVDAMAESGAHTWSGEDLP